jgi:acyl-CoA thioesterase
MGGTSVRGSSAHGSPVHGLDAATALAGLGDGEYETSLDEGWWIEGTAYGGYLAAVLVRASSGLDAVSGLRPLSTCVQFHAPTSPGHARVRVRALHAGRSAASVLAEVEQDGETRAAALSCFGKPRTGPDLALAARMTGVAGPADCVPLTVRPEVAARFRLAQRFERRRLPATPGIDTGGWIRFAEQRPLDAMGAVALLDSWTAAATAHVRVDRMLTLSYFVQFLAPLTAAPADFVLATFTCDAARDGYAEDAGELRDANGTILARSRQVVCIAR